MHVFIVEKFPLFLHTSCVYFLTLGCKQGRVRVGCHPLSEVFLSFFLDNKPSAPDVFSSCSFTPLTHFETCLIMVSHYGYDI